MDGKYFPHFQAQEHDAWQQKRTNLFSLKGFLTRVVSDVGAGGSLPSYILRGI
jgi:hypothetical protein